MILRSWDQALHWAPCSVGSQPLPWVVMPENPPCRTVSGEITALQVCQKHNIARATVGTLQSFLDVLEIVTATHRVGLRKRGSYFSGLVIASNGKWPRQRPLADELLNESMAE